MRKKLSIGLLLGAALAVSLYSCRSEDLLSNSEEAPPSKFKVFTSVNGERVNYGEGFKILMEKHDSLNNEQHTAKAMKNAFENSRTVAEEYIEFNIRTKDQFSDIGERWIVYPVISNSSVTGLVAGILNKEETTVEFRNLKPGNEYYDQLIPLFREQFQKSLISARQLNRNGKCGFPMQPPCEIDVIIITPPNSGGGGGIGIGIGGGGGEGTPKPCPKYADCIDNNPGGGGGGGVPLPYEDPKTPCEKVKAQTSNSTFKSNITSLKGKTGDNYESGYRIGTGLDGSLQSQLLQNKPGTQEVELKAFPNTTTLMHSHYDALFPMFSPGDIIFFNQWIVWAQNWNSVATNNPKIPLNNLTLTVVTSNGDYSFTFDGTSVTPLPNYTIQEIKDLNSLYIRMLDEARTVANVSGNISYNMPKLEKQFLKFMGDKMKMSGLKLFRTENNGNTELNLKSNGTLNETDCPK